MNSPESDTRLASGLTSAKLTLTGLGAVGLAAGAATAAFSGDISGADWAGDFGDGGAAAGDAFGAMALTGAFCSTGP